MRYLRFMAAISCVLGIFGGSVTGMAQDGSAPSPEKRQAIRALYIPLADHYPGIVAYEKYRGAMKHAAYTISKMKSWPLLRATFTAGQADMAYIISPMAMDMFARSPTFRWVSLLHRDGNALAINDLLNARVKLPVRRLNRRPDANMALALLAARQELGRATECAVPSLLATHTVVLYKYLKDHGRTLGLGTGLDRDVVAIEVAPPRSPAFIKKQASRGIPASFEQSLPWADVVETGKFGLVAWYSKDVLPWPRGHVECIAIASDRAIKEKRAALAEVISFIHQAGQDIEAARRTGGAAMDQVVAMIRNHIPQHNAEAIKQSLRADLDVINYRFLNVDRGGLKQVMTLALEGGILRRAIDIEAFADDSFATAITNKTAGPRRVARPTVAPSGGAQGAPTARAETGGAGAGEAGHGLAAPEERGPWYLALGAGAGAVVLVGLWLLMRRREGGQVDHD